MFFAAILAAPVLAGVVAGVVSDRRLVPAALAGVCLALGAAGAIVTGLDSDTTDRGSSVAFGVVGGIVAAALVWLGYAAGKLTRRGTARSS